MRIIWRKFQNISESCYGSPVGTEKTSVAIGVLKAVHIFPGTTMMITMCLLLIILMVMVMVMVMMLMMVMVTMMMVKMEMIYSWHLLFTQMPWLTFRLSWCLKTRFINNHCEDEDSNIACNIFDDNDEIHVNSDR